MWPTDAYPDRAYPTYYWPAAPHIHAQAYTVNLYCNPTPGTSLNSQPTPALDLQANPTPGVSLYTG